jgi:transposase
MGQEDPTDADHTDPVGDRSVEADGGAGAAGSDLAALPGGATGRRYRAMYLLAQGQTPQQVAAALGCCLASVYNWATAWQRAGRTDLGDQPRAGRPQRLEADGEQRLEALLASDPQAHGRLATGWTVPLRQTQ